MGAKIYTKTGDRGLTSLIDGERVSKNHPRLWAYGEMDELGCYVSELICLIESELSLDLSSKKELLKTLKAVQDQLFKSSSLLASPDPTMLDATFHVTAQLLELFESQIDEWTDALPELKNFILPGGHILSCKAHVCRSVCRRVERRIEALADQSWDKDLIKFINRLSDWFFTAARYLNLVLNTPEVIWTSNPTP